MCFILKYNGELGYRDFNLDIRPVMLYKFKQTGIFHLESEQICIIFES